MMKLTDNTTIEELLEAILNCGCSCDIMNVPIRCSIHLYINRLRRILLEKGVIE